MNMYAGDKIPRLTQAGFDLLYMLSFAGDLPTPVFTSRVHDALDRAREQKWIEYYIGTDSQRIARLTDAGKARMNADIAEYGLPASMIEDIISSAAPYHLRKRLGMVGAQPSYTIAPEVSFPSDPALVAMIDAASMQGSGLATDPLTPDELIRLYNTMDGGAILEGKQPGDYGNAILIAYGQRVAAAALERAGVSA